MQYYPLKCSEIDVPQSVLQYDTSIHKLSYAPQLGETLGVK